MLDIAIVSILLNMKKIMGYNVWYRLHRNNSKDAVVCFLLVSFVCCRVTRYLDYRHPPWSADKYTYTTQYWHVAAARFIFVVCFEVCRFKTLIHVVVQQHMLTVATCDLIGCISHFNSLILLVE